MQFVALGYLVDRLTQSPLYLGVLAVSQAIPRILCSIVGGAVADRVDRRSLLLATNFFLMCSAIVLTVLTLTGRIQIWEILLLAALNSAVAAFDMPARHSLVPLLVEQREILTAISLNSAAFNGAGILGPSLGGLVIAFAGEAGCFLLNALSYLAVLAALRWMAPVARTSATGMAFIEDVQEGLRLLRANRLLLRCLGTVAVLSFFGRPYVRMMPALAREVLHVEATGLGLLQSAPGVGTICSVLLIGWLSGSGKGVMLSLAMLLFGVGIVALGFAQSYSLALLLLVVIGMVQSLALSTANAIIQLNAPPHTRGRVMGLYGIVAFGGFATGSLPVGALAGLIGIGPALAAGGLVVVLLAVLLLPRFRQIS